MKVSEFVTNNGILSTSQISSLNMNFLDDSSSFLIGNIMIFKYGILDMIDGSTGGIQYIIQNFFEMHRYNWTTKFNTINVYYNPLTNFDVSNISNTSESGNDKFTQSKNDTGNYKDEKTASNESSGNSSNSGNDNSTNTPNITDTTYKNTYDNLSLTPIDKTENSGNTTTVSSNSASETHSDRNSLTDSATHTNNLSEALNNQTDYGKITIVNDSKKSRENVSAQELIKEEREIAEYNFYEMIADELITIVALSTFNFD